LSHKKLCTVVNNENNRNIAGRGGRKYSEGCIFIEWQGMCTHSRTGVIWKSRDKYLVSNFSWCILFQLKCRPWQCEAVSLMLHHAYCLCTICAPVCLSIVGKTTGATYLIIFGGGGQCRTWMLGTLRCNQVRKRWKIGFSQSLIDVNTIPPLSTIFFLFACLQLGSQKTILRQRKILGH